LVLFLLGGAAQRIVHELFKDAATMIQYPVVEFCYWCRTDSFSVLDNTE
jgi:hypothetical protein